MTNKKKLIEVALPLKAINEASAPEKSIRHGHPSTMRLWCARVVIFAERVDSPPSYLDLFSNEKSWGGR